MPISFLDGKDMLSGAHPREVLSHSFDLTKHGKPAGRKGIVPTDGADTTLFR